MSKTKKKSSKSKKVEASDAGNDEEMRPGAIYLSHIPHGFYEREMNGFFSQFGTVTRLRLFRSKKTNRSRGYAFVEFECSEVAKVVAETMNNYLLFEKLLKCKYVDSSSLLPHTFYPKKFVKSKQTNPKPKTAAEVRRHISNVLKREKKRRERLKQLNIDYDFPGYTAAASVRPIKSPVHTVFSQDSDDSDIGDTVTENKC